MKNNYELLNKYYSLPEKIAVYIPSTIDVNVKCDTTKYSEYFENLFSKLFGGCSAMPINGFWISDKTGLVKENIFYIYANSDHETINNSLESILTDVKKMCSELKQDCISLEINGILHFITAD